MIPVARMSAAAAVCGRDRDAQWFNLNIYSINLFLHHEDDDDDDDDDDVEDDVAVISKVPFLCSVEI